MSAQLWTVPATTFTAPVWQLVAFSVVVVAPEAQSVQRRLRVRLGVCDAYVPGSHVDQAEQVAALVVALKVPALHAVQVRFVVALPSATILWPAAQVAQSTHAVAEEPSWSQVPLEQLSLAAVPPAQKVPASQAPHVVGDEDVPASVCAVPGSHVPTGAHVASFGADVYVPDSQAEHVRSVVGLAATSMRVPGAHVVQAEQLGAFVVMLKVPLAHAVQDRSVVALPPAVTACPAVHAVHAVHAVAELPSWSQLPLLQACFGVEPPAQYVPLSQVAHTAADVGVAGAVSSVPAAQALADTQLDWFGDDEYVPAPQVVHTRSLDEVAAVLT